MAKTKKRQKRHVKHVEKSEAPNVPMNSAFDDVLFGWFAPEYIRYERGWKWYLFAGLVDALLIYYAYLTEAWTMAMVFAILPLVYALDHNKKPKLTRVELSSWGIRFGVLELPYTEINQFWIHHQPPHLDELRLKTKNRMHPEVVIPLMGANPSLIRQFLLTQIPELEGKSFPFLDLVTRFLRLH